MLRLIGSFTVWAALALAVYGMVAGIVGVRTRNAALSRSARASSYTIFALMTVSNLAMIAGVATQARWDELDRARITAIARSRLHNLRRGRHLVDVRQHVIVRQHRRQLRRLRL